MELLYYHPSSRVWKDKLGAYYTLGSYTDEVWNRYLELTDNLTICFRLSKDILSKENAERTRKKIVRKEISVVELPDINSSKKLFFNFQIISEFNTSLSNAVKKCDFAIIRQPDKKIVTFLKKYRKPYLVEVVGPSFESLWYHSWKGKMLALYSEIRTKMIVKNAPWVIYVTQEYLQKRYPTNGRSLGCSDASIIMQEPLILEKRIKKIKRIKNKLIIGTIGALHIKDKGQVYVIKALSMFKDKDIEYQLVGDGNNLKLMNEAKRIGVSDKVFFLGRYSHERVLEWLQSIDVYIQPSLDEGMPRSVMEAMSVGLPIIASNVGGISELIEREMLVEPKNYREISNKINSLSEKRMIESATYNYKHSLQYNINSLAQKREGFYKEFKEWAMSQNSVVDK